MPPLLQLKGLVKRFPGVQALRGVDFELANSEVHALVGENGAGKSTLIKVIAGVHRPDEGSYRIDGADADIHDPRQAMAAGIRVVYQELELVPDLSVAENVFFGRLPAKGGRVDWSRLHADTRDALAQVGLNIDPRTLIRRLGIGPQQLVEIARALSQTARVLILDEPTSALSPTEIDRLFGLLRRLRRDVGIIYVSHKLEEITSLSDRVTVLRDGQLVGTHPTAELDEQRIIQLMVGRELTDAFPHMHRAHGEPVLEVEDLTTGRVQDVSLQVRAGEVVGLSGLMGAGRTELLRAIIGADRRRAGRVQVADRELGANSTTKARKLGLGLVPEDRRGHGIFADMSVLHNATIASLAQFAHAGWLRIRNREEMEVAGCVVERMAVRTPSLAQAVALLSGGNQQKVLLARWLLKRDLKVLLVDEPTRGIDVGARFEIYKLIDELADEGLAVLVVSSEMEEILGLCDRIYVMKEGAITAEFDRADADQESLLSAAL
ncbi:MAG: sugar ABC transporter ATP-binding protein [Candidatus Latescibacterota bacterium]|nr:sugar ABC transporter ATP-binding protein [Candidatus Latescibacterota bacterium]